MKLTTRETKKYITTDSIVDDFDADSDGTMHFPPHFIYIRTISLMLNSIVTNFLRFIEEEARIFINWKNVADQF